LLNTANRLNKKHHNFSMHDRDTNSIEVGISNSGTTNIANTTVICTQIFINCSSGGNANNFTLSLKDRTPGRTWVGPLTLSTMSNGPLVIPILSPLRFQDGVVAVAAGNVGTVAVAISSQQNLQGQQ
jgi:hypothetical protein